MKFLFLFFLFWGCSTAANGQAKVANYACGERGTEAYEHFSFWVKDGQKSGVFYTYGKEAKELRLQTLNHSRSGFDVLFPNGHKLSVKVAGNRLNATDAARKYNKIFRWKYEGPVNGVGTFCQPCAGNEKEAMVLMKAHYFK